MSLVPLTPSLRLFLEGYLPKAQTGRPFITLTYAQSLDSRIAAKPGEQTKISHLETKTMTHYLRSKHDGILVGIGTVLADDPKLNCRFKDDVTDKISTPRPIILDPNGKWIYHKSQLRKICDDGNGLAPFILIDESITPRSQDVDMLDKQNGKYISLPLLKSSNKLGNWNLILPKLFELGIGSIMVEGGAKTINDLLVCHNDNKKNLIDSLIITIGPVFLGNQGVEVSPSQHIDLVEVQWWTGIQDSVLCARVSK